MLKFPCKTSHSLVLNALLCVCRQRLLHPVTQLYISSAAPLNPQRTLSHQPTQPLRSLTFKPLDRSILHPNRYENKHKHTHGEHLVQIIIYFHTVKVFAPAVVVVFFFLGGHVGVISGLLFTSAKGVNIHLCLDVMSEED